MKLLRWLAIITGILVGLLVLVIVGGIYVFVVWQPVCTITQKSSISIGQSADARLSNPIYEEETLNIDCQFP